MQFELWDSDDVSVPRKELLQKVRGVDGLLCVLTEKIDAELLDAAGERRSLRSANGDSSVKTSRLLSSLPRRSEPEGAQHHVCGF